MLELATPADREAVERIARQVHRLHIQWRPDLYRMPEEMFPQERFEQMIRERQLYAAKLNGEVVGFAEIRFLNYDWPAVVNRKTMAINSIAVEQSCQGQGIGTMMMQDLRALAKAFGCRDMQLAVYPQNDGAVAFYQKCGFTIRSISMQSGL